jgi:cell division protein FtsI (penicillin-binding protein 3)
VRSRPSHLRPAFAGRAAPARPARAGGAAGTHSSPSRSPARLILVFAVLMITFGAMAARLVVLQVVESPAYARLASRQRQTAIEFPARRGAIFDRHGRSLAVSVDLQTIYTDPALVVSPLQTARKLAPVLGRGVFRLKNVLEGDPPSSRFEYVARQVSPGVAEAVEALDLPGIYMKPEPKRFYPNGNVAAQVLGFVGRDGVGLAGLEAQYERVLRGRAGRMMLEQDPAGRALPQAGVVYERPVPGSSLYLTIDKDIQFQTERELSSAVRRYGAKGGTAVVMRPRTGAVLAMASTPGFDPNHFSDEPEEAYRNRAVTDVYEPGSSYKVVTFAAALEEGVVSPHTKFVVPDSFPYADRVFHDSHFHPTERMSVAEIIEQSSNVGTIKIGLRLGGGKLDEYVRKFGFGARTGLDFPGESPGIVVDRKQWSGTTIATVPIGQGVAVTTVQMAGAFATLANDGVWVEPRVVAATVDDDGAITRAPEPERRRVVSAKTAQKMAWMLRNVVARGTGVQAQVPGYRIAGKTGTAQKPLPSGGYGDSYVASFAGYVPVENPALVAIVVLDDPDPIWGGATAAPTFRAIAGYALRRLGVPPTSNARRAAAELEAAQEGIGELHD